MLAEGQREAFQRMRPWRQWWQIDPFPAFGKRASLKTWQETGQQHARFACSARTQDGNDTLGCLLARFGLQGGLERFEQFGNQRVSTKEIPCILGRESTQALVGIAGRRCWLWRPNGRCNTT